MKDVMVIVSLAMVLLKGSWEDIKSREVGDYIHVCLLLIALMMIGNDWRDLLVQLGAGLLLCLPMAACAFISKGSIGGADIKLTFSMGVLLGLQRGVAALLLGMTVAVIVETVIRLVRKNDLNKGFPLIPYLAIGTMIISVFG